MSVSSQLRPRTTLHPVFHRLDPRARHLCILRRRTGTHTNRAYYLSFYHERYPTSDQRESPAIAIVNPIPRTPRQEVLRARRVHGGGDTVAGGGEGFVDRDVDAGEFRIGHAREMQEVERGVDDGDVEVYNAFYP